MHKHQFIFITRNESAHCGIVTNKIILCLNEITNNYMHAYLDFGWYPAMLHRLYLHLLYAYIFYQFKNANNIYYSPFTLTNS